MKLTKRLSLLTTTTAIAASAISLFIGSASSQTSADQQAVPNEVRFIAAGIEDASQQLECGQAKLKLHRYQPKEFFNDRANITKDVDEKYEAQWSYNQSKIDILMRFEGRDVKLPVTQRFVINPEEDRILYEYSGEETSKTKKISQYRGWVNPHGVMLDNGLIKNYQETDPRFYAYYMGRFPLNDLLLRRTGEATFDKMSAPVFKGEATLYGARCMMVQVSPSQEDQWVFWVDVEHGFITRKQEIFVIRRGKSVLYSEIHIPKLIESGGRWLPSVVEAKEYKINWKGQADRMPVATTKLEITDFQTDCDFPKETFTLKWPAGTDVTDSIKQTSYQIAAGTDEKSQAKANIAKGTKISASIP